MSQQNQSSWFKNINDYYEPKVFLNTTPDASLDKPVCDPCTGEDAHVDEVANIKTTKSSISKTLTVRRDKTKEKREVTDSNETIFELDYGIEEMIGDTTDSRDKINDFKETEVTRMIKEAETEIESVSTPISVRGCGEPMRSQHLILDFNPVKGVDDNEEKSKRCADFWEFIDKHKELHHLKVMPELEDYHESDNTVSVSNKVSTPVSDELGLTPITVMTLNWLKKENVMSDSLATNHAKSPCEPVSKKYTEYLKWGNSLAKKSYRKQASKTGTPALTANAVPKSSATSKTIIGGIKAPTGRKEDDLEQLMAEMDKWDLEHPKAMKLPELVPTLVHAKTSILPLIEQGNEITCEKCLQ